MPTIAPTPSAIRCGQDEASLQPVLGRHILMGAYPLLRIPPRHRALPLCLAAAILVRRAVPGKRGGFAQVENFAIFWPNGRYKAGTYGLDLS